MKSSQQLGSINKGSLALVKAYVVAVGVVKMPIEYITNKFVKGL
ncbi:MAG TPA: hypothetical protein VE548_08250 [Nitrososphaeraceae archaeon]|jgi:hypothetical protein|nr:hypothetical protein [Nitrososphaeraceae archaeon]